MKLNFSKNRCTKRISVFLILSLAVAQLEAQEQEFTVLNYNALHGFRGIRWHSKNMSHG